MNRVLFGLAFAGVLALGAAETPPLWEALPAKLAEYNGTAVTRDEVAAYAREVLPEEKWSPEALQLNLYGVVKGMIDGKLLREARNRAGIYPSQELALAMLQGVYDAIPADRRRAMAEARPAKEGALESYLEALSRDPAIQEETAFELFLRREVLKGGITVSEAEARDYYNSRKWEFRENKDPAKGIRISQILIAADPQRLSKKERAAGKKLAEGVAEEISRTPGSFDAKLAEYAGKPFGRNSGTIVFTAGQKQVPEALEKAAAALDVGAVAPKAVETDLGYHILRRDELRKERELSFEEALPELKLFLHRRKEAAAFDAYVKGLEEAAKVKFFIPVRELE